MRIKPADTTEWYKQDGDNTFRINYPQLTPRSIVVDLGARIGSWADIIEGNYACRVFCFEAVEQYCKVLLGKGYQVHQKAVTDKEGTVWLGIVDGEASIFNPGDQILCDSIPAWEIFYLIKSDKIDLMKINVEGAEYKILQSLITSGRMKDITNLQVQFHEMEGAGDQYALIAAELEKTHELTWRFPFVWENWKLRESK